ncbi:hypothetical protein JR316_0011259 [Psilocybe cubensis]|uniref:Uncharacterized protein n=2 Tax=Psilocybe cubensis TaxID=181762 RepID=A0A8H7XTY7_PSICU|nr:hypothetical protein JR316_0011259 [Psilocybe cubensis]KAH9475700.1 hypothetical protein JR316_0011259 [Psilocybe cubensis]
MLNSPPKYAPTAEHTFMYLDANNTPQDYTQNVPILVHPTHKRAVTSVERNFRSALSTQHSASSSSTMRFFTQLTGLCMTVASIASMAAQASPVESSDVVTVTVYDQPAFNGEAYTPNPLLPGINTLPEEWWYNVASLKVSNGWYCLFFHAPQGDGEFIVLQGNVLSVPPPFFRNIASFRCRRGFYIPGESR